MSSKWPFIILVKYASRGRRSRFLEGLSNIFSLCSQPDFIRVLITADEDDPEMNNAEVKKSVANYKNAHIVYGRSNNKVHAINRDLYTLPNGWDNWDILANFSDDMRWTANGWDDQIRIDFNAISPDFSHYMAYLDPDTKGALSTLFIAGRKWVDYFGFIYDPVFISLFCDNLVEDSAKHLGKYHYTGLQIYQHFNPSYGYERFEPDQLYIDQQKIGWSIDSKTYFDIKELGMENYLSKFNVNG